MPLYLSFLSPGKLVIDHMCINLFIPRERCAFLKEILQTMCFQCFISTMTSGILFPFKQLTFPDLAITLYVVIILSRFYVSRFGRSDCFLNLVCLGCCFFFKFVKIASPHVISRLKRICFVTGLNPIEHFRSSFLNSEVFNRNLTKMKVMILWVVVFYL